jgi:hypothetical protein
MCTGLCFCVIKKLNGIYLVLGQNKNIIFEHKSTGDWHLSNSFNHEIFEAVTDLFSFVISIVYNNS